MNSRARDPTNRYCLFVLCISYRFFYFFKHVTMMRWPSVFCFVCFFSVCARVGEVCVRRRRCTGARFRAAPTRPPSFWASFVSPPGNVNKNRVWLKNQIDLSSRLAPVGANTLVCLLLTLSLASFLISSCSLFRMWRLGLFFLAYCCSSITLLSEFSCVKTEQRRCSAQTPIYAHQQPRNV